MRIRTLAHLSDLHLGLSPDVEQAAEAFLLWRGVRPQTAAVLADLRARVDAGQP